MWNRIKHWWQAEGALVGLQGVSDRMLKDMGLEREGLRDRVLGREADPLAPTPAPCACAPAGRLARS
jgi:hypothetical protein